MIRLMLGLLLVALAAPSAAQTTALDAARRAGIIGERFDGYLGYAVAPSAMLRSQVEAINIRRRALYANLAARKGVSPQEVGITAGCQLLARVGVGQAYLLNDGAWRRRAAGQATPVPTYCG
jgi:uncharacterized protein YdbL (DUF1318 family)